VARIVAVGEGMAELLRREGGWTLGYAGDVLNTAIYLARAGHDVALLSAVGTDPFSGELRRKCEAEGLDASLLLTHRDRQIGLYAVSTDARGERSFTYWRESSAARAMFALPESEAALTRAVDADLLYFSLITLAILPRDGRRQLLALASRVGAGGGKVAFDSNYRPRLWSSADEARSASDAAIACAHIGLPTLDDETALHGTADAAAVAARWAALGCGETVVKLGAGGCRLSDGRIVAPPRPLEPVDTSGAGDAFNAAYLSARLREADAMAAAMQGHALASWTIMRPGGIPAPE
jgi:2-dehydro-3-deoxygluconokinase